MVIRKLQVAGLRSFEQAEFTFQPGMNLLVGVNGVGKSTTLDALRACLSHVLPEITSSVNKKLAISISSIRLGSDSTQIICDFELNGKSFGVLIHKHRVNNIFNKDNDIIEVSDAYVITPELATIFPHIRHSRQQPLGIYFSTRRSLIVDKEPSKSSAAGGQAAAFSDSLLPNREINLRIIAQWFRAQLELGGEDPDLLQHVGALQSAVNQFLPHFSNLRVVENDEKIGFEIDKHGISLRINQLSDGERGVLALVLDLARRLSQANPGLKDPIRDGVAIVLIDELDLHLHPKWQRSIVENLTRTFPNCQFIVTTHSPQIIGEVKPERITIIDQSIYRPSSSFGMDSSRILEEIMDTDSRNSQIENIVSMLSQKIDTEELGAAKELLARLKSILGSDDPEVVRSATMIDFLESDVDE